MTLVRAARGERVADLERIIERPDGTRVVVCTNARQVSDRDGTILGVIATMRDVTVERELEREREAILSAVVHDLKNPLTAIKGLTILLSRRIKRMEMPEEVSETVLRNLDGIDAKSDQMLDLLNEFMEAARNIEGTALELRPVDLIALVQRSIASRAATGENRVIRVETPECDVVGYWDATQLERSLDNLVANAIKYSPDGSEIVVSIRRESDGGQAVLTVKDQGIGIPESDQAHVFDRFYRAHNAGNVHGTGIGLASVKRIVARHGGEIGLVSREGQGTTVEVRLPLDGPR